MNVRKMWTKALLAESLQQQMKVTYTGGLAPCRPVFDVAEKFFLYWLGQFPKQEFSGEEFTVINELDVALEASSLNETTAWASVFVRLYYCDNFPGFAKPAWTWLLRHDPNNLRYAIQACRYVQLSSGASGWEELKRMIKQNIPDAASNPILDEVASDDV